MSDRPEIVDDDHLDFLDELRESGATNMFGGGAYIQQAFGVTEKDARVILGYWMDTFPRTS